MKITLIEPAMLKKPGGLSEKPIFCFQPLALAVLAGLTPPEIQLEIIDDRFENIDYAAPRDLVGISVKTFTARRAYQIADEFRRRGILVILGGHHVSLLPEEAQTHADSVFVGEAEMLWSTVLQDLLRGKIQPRYEGGHEKCFPLLHTDRACLQNKHYLPVSPIETARGCPYNCSFCSVSAFYNHTFRRRDIAQVVDELRSLPRRPILFVDDNIVGDIESAKELFSALIPLKIRWVSQASISIARDLELLELMRKSGCAGLLIGIESIFSENLHDVRKGWNIARQDYLESLRLIREHRFAVVGSFIVGMQHDTDESLDATLEFAIRQKLFAVLFNMLIPFPQTDLYRQLQSEDRLRYLSWWLHPDYRYGQAVFTPKNFSALWIEKKRMQMYRKFYGPRSVLTRLLEFQVNSRDLWHALTYLSINLPGYAQENARYGVPLGSNDPHSNP